MWISLTSVSAPEGERAGAGLWRGWRPCSGGVVDTAGQSRSNSASFNTPRRFLEAAALYIKMKSAVREKKLEEYGSKKCLLVIHPAEECLRLVFKIASCVDWKQKVYAS